MKFNGNLISGLSSTVGNANTKISPVTGIPPLSFQLHTLPSHRCSSKNEKSRAAVWKIPLLKKQDNTQD